VDKSGASPNQSLARGLEILSQFTYEDRTLTLAELGRRLGLHRATIHRFVKTLEIEGLLVPTGAGSYAVGPAWAMALFALGSDTAFAEILNSDLRSLADSSLETVALGVRRGDHVQTVHVVPASRSFAPTLPANRLHPLHALWNVHSQILLAHADEVTKRRLLAITQVRVAGNAAVESEAARARLQRVLTERVAYDREESMLGMCAVGVPLMQRGRAVAALALLVPVERFTEATMPFLLGQLRVASTHMKRRLEA
jgi:DNA-binding IclR family transcriptional regulator